MNQECQSSQHEWEYCRRYTGLEVLRVNHLEIYDPECDDGVVTYDALRHNNSILKRQVDVYPVVGDVRTDEVIEGGDEWLECRYCGLRIEGERMKEVEFG